MVGSDTSLATSTVAAGSNLTAISNLTEAARAVVRVARQLEHATTELTLPQYRLMVLIATGDQRASKLAGRLALSKPTVTAVVEGLVERGYLSRSEVWQDRRAVDLSLTEAGSAALARCDTAIGERMAWLLTRCADPAAALAGLLQLSVAVDQVVADRIADKLADGAK